MQIKVSSQPRWTFGRSALLAVLFLVAGCSSFKRDWKHPADAGDDRLAGRWEGSWLSDINGHHGKLRCIVTRTNGPDYRARFRATYQLFLHFSYDVDLHAQPDGGSLRFEGEADLRLAGGVYHYAGRADGSNFTATYSSQYDHGTFRMSRPEPR